jgi:hypothetical protein
MIHHFQYEQYFYDVWHDLISMDEMVQESKSEKGVQKYHKLIRKVKMICVHSRDLASKYYEPFCY